MNVSYFFLSKTINKISSRNLPVIFFYEVSHTPGYLCKSSLSTWNFPFRPSILYGVAQWRWDACLKRGGNLCEIRCKKKY